MRLFMITENLVQCKYLVSIFIIFPLTFDGAKISTRSVLLIIGWLVVLRIYVALAVFQPYRR